MHFDSYDIQYVVYSYVHPRPPTVINNLIIITGSLILLVIFSGFLSFKWCFNSYIHDPVLKSLQACPTQGFFFLTVTQLLWLTAPYFQIPTHIWRVYCITCLGKFFMYRLLVKLLHHISGEYTSATKIFSSAAFENVQWKAELFEIARGWFDWLSDSSK